MTCVLCNGVGRLSRPNASWVPGTTREPHDGLGPHGRPTRVCPACGGSGQVDPPPPADTTYLQRHPSGILGLPA